MKGYPGWGRHWPLLGSFLRRRAFEVLSRRAASGDEEAVRTLGESLPRLGDPALRDRVLEALATAGEREVPLAREILCSLVLEEDDDRARELCLTRGFAPEDEARRAVFFVLTGQWEEYDSLDFHQRLLKRGYWSAGEGVRRRILARLRSAGRSEWLRRLLLEGPGTPGEPRIRDMGEEEWNAMTASLAAQGRWPELARLAEVAPLRRGVAILRTLGRAADRSFLREEELEELVRLAEDWEGEAKAAGELVMGRLAWKKKQEGWVEHLSFSPDGRYLALASWDCTVRLFDLAEKAFSWTGRHGDAVWGVAFSPDGKLVVSGSSDGTVRLWQVADGSCLWVKKHQGPVWAVVLSSDGRYLASGGREGVVRLFRLQDRECLWRRRHDDAVFALSFSPDGQYLASGGKDRTVRLFRASDGDLLWMADHGGAVWTVLFSPDGKYLVSRVEEAGGKREGVRGARRPLGGRPGRPLLPPLSSSDPGPAFGEGDSGASPGGGPGGGVPGAGPFRPRPGGGRAGGGAGLLRPLAPRAR